MRSLLFRKNIEPRCAYCARAASLAGGELLCRKKGIVEGSSSCRSFRYDPLRRVPPKPAVLRSNYSAQDLTWEDPDDDNAQST